MPIYKVNSMMIVATIRWTGRTFAVVGFALEPTASVCVLLDEVLIRRALAQHSVRLRYCEQIGSLATC